MGKPVSIIVIVFLLFWGIYGTYLVFFLVALQGPEAQEPDVTRFVARLLKLADPTAIPEDVRRGVGAALFGVALAFMARERGSSKAAGRWIFGAGLVVAAAAACVTLLFIGRVPFGQAHGGGAVINLVTGMNQRVLELALTLLSALAGLRLIGRAVDNG